MSTLDEPTELFGTFFYRMGRLIEPIRAVLDGGLVWRAWWGLTLHVSPIMESLFWWFLVHPRGEGRFHTVCQSYTCLPYLQMGELYLSPTILMPVNTYTYGGWIIRNAKNWPCKTLLFSDWRMVGLLDRGLSNLATLHPFNLVFLWWNIFASHNLYLLFRVLFVKSKV